jgi:autoinducer 2 (AI-2) kinase
MTANGRYIATIDVGSGSGRCIIFDLNGRQLSVSQREWLPKTDPKYPGSQNFDTKEAWTALCATSREAIAKAGIKASEVAVVTATAMREGMVLYDKNKEVIWACPNVDGRATAEAAEMIKKDLARSIYNIGGDWLSIISPPRLWWIKAHQPEIYEKIAHMNMISDWVLFKLSDILVTDPSIGSSSGMFDLSKRTWSDEIIRLADLPKGIYADVFESGSVIGNVTRKAAEDTGFCEGTLVVTGGADTQMALVGVGAVKPMMYTVCAGTFWQTTVVADKPLFDKEFRPRSLCHAVPGQWMTEGIGFYHGFTMRWFRDGFCQDEKRKAAELKTDAYSLMEELASQVPAGSNGVQGIFANVMDAKRWVHAVPSFVGFDLLAPEKTGKAACIRAIEENAAYVTRGHMDVLIECTGKKPEEIIFAGGSSKGFLWPQIVADVLGVSVKVPDVKEATSLGSAVCGMIALGEVKDWSQGVDRVVHWDKRFEPDAKIHAIYNEKYQLWKGVYQEMMPMAEKRLLTPLFWAPGA